MAKRMSASKKVCRMVEQGYNTKDIIAKLKVPPSMVYNVRYKLNKAKGLTVKNPSRSTSTSPKKLACPACAGTGIAAPESMHYSLWERIVKVFRG